MIYSKCVDSNNLYAITNESLDPWFYIRDDKRLMCGVDLCWKPTFLNLSHVYLLITPTEFY